MKKPKISIITVTYNSELTLERTINSVLSQNYDNLEYIIVDGGSTDHTLDIVKKYKNQIKWISEPDDGISDAFDKGISLATGDIIGIINSDDGLVEGSLEALAQNYDPSVDVYRGKVLLWKEDTNTKVVEVPSMTFNLNGRYNVSHQSTFVSKEAYNRYGTYDKSLRYVMDCDLLHRYQNAGAKFKYVDAVLAFYTFGGRTFGKYTKERYEETKYMLKKNGASRWKIFEYFVIKFTKIAVTKVIGKRLQMLIKHKLLRKKMWRSV